MARKDWKKHLLRVKQIADQNLGRVEKTEALTADLQVLEKKVDLFGKVYYNTGKKLQAFIQGQGQEVEKRMKKIPEFQLGQSLTESSSLLTVDTLLGEIFQICGDGEGMVASKRLHQEMCIESKVLQPIHALLETSIPAIQKHKKTLQKMVLDMDSAKTRYQSAQKQQQAEAKSTSTAKVDSLRDEYDEACYRVDHCRDQLATEMFQLASKESELSHIMLELVKCQADFHRKALDCLEKRIPQMEDQLNRWSHMPVYGKPLDDHLKRTSRDIALVIEECVKNLCSLGGLEEEGLFRIAGASNKIKKLKAAFDSEQCADIAEEYDVHCIAGALKLYLREMPDPLMDSSLFTQWMQAAHLQADQRLPALADVLVKLPTSNYNNLRYLIKFLAKLTDNQEINKMSSSNIAIVMGPNLIWPQGEGGPSVLTTSTQSSIVEALISHCNYFFQGVDDDILEQYIQDSLVASQQHAPDYNSVPSIGMDAQYYPDDSPPPPIHRSSTPDFSSQNLHSAPAQNLISAVHPAVTANAPSPMGSQENMTSSTGNLSFQEHSGATGRNGSVSPKPPRRINKKPAPLPPGERPSGPAPAPPPCAADKSALPYPIKSPLPDRPMSSPDTAAAVTRPDRPPSPPRARSTGGSLSSTPDRQLSAGERPDKPEKPAKPERSGNVEKLYPTLPPASPSAAQPPQCKPKPSLTGDGSPQAQIRGDVSLQGRVENSPPQPTKQSHGGETADKPPIPPPPVVKPEHSSGPETPVMTGHRRSGSTGAKPPRPTPPAPPTAAKPTTVTEEGIQRLPSVSGEPKPDEQTYL